MRDMTYTKFMDKVEKRIFVIFSLVLGGIFAFVCLYLAYFWLSYPLNYKNSIQMYANKYKLDPSLIASIINEESSFDKDAISSKGAIGLMQIMPRTAVFADMLNENLDTKTLIDSETNIKLGCRYIEYLKQKFNDEKVVLACYNAGEGIVLKWLQDKRYSQDGKTLKFVPYKETREYIKKVQKGKEIYKSKF